MDDSGKTKKERLAEDRATKPRKPKLKRGSQNITERKSVEEALRESEERYHAIFEQAADAVVIFDAETKEMVEFNNKAYENLGYSREEFKKLRLSDIEADESAEEITRHTEKIIREGADTFEAKHKTKHEEIRDVLVSAKVIHIKGKDLIQGIWRDITERKKAEEQLKASLKEKEVLIREIHHRVKNNLQVISSLFKLQSEYIRDKRMLEMLKQSQNRVRTMALIHEKLYQSKDLVKIDFADYIRSLATYLFRLYEVSSDAITLKIDAGEVSLGIDSAVPCGLIVSELVSNSLKHAFPAGKKGQIRIEFHSDRDNQFTLIVSDNGVGLPKDLDFRKAESLGLQLVNILTGQLGGGIELDRTDGTTVKITFTETQEGKDVI